MKRLLSTFTCCAIAGILLSSCGTETTASLTIKGSTSSTARAVSARLASLIPLVSDPFRVAAGNVSSVKFTIQSIYVSTNTDCSNPVLVADLGAGQEFDMATGPTLFTGSPPNGTYVCVGMGMKDIITWAPDTTAQVTNAGCNPATSQTFDIYRTNSGDSPNWKTITGANITATGDGVTMGPDDTFLFASRNATELAAGAIAPHANQTVTMASSLTVPGNAIFYSDFTGQVDGSPTTCDLNGVTFGFR